MENVNTKEKQSQSMVDFISLGILKIELGLLPIITLVCLFKLVTSVISLF